MKKVTASLLLLFPLLLLGQISPKMNYNIGSASTQFGANLSAGSDVYDAGTKKKYTITESVSSTGTLNATINKIEWSPSTHTHANMVSISGATASGYIPIFSSGTTITSSDLSLTGSLITTGYNFLINGNEATNFQINDVPDGITVFKVSSEDDKISFFDNSFSYTYHGIGTESLYGVLGITGLVGIGTLSPAVPLHVSTDGVVMRVGSGTNTSVVMQFAANGSTNRAQFGYANNYAIVQGGNTKGVQIAVNNNTFGSGVVASFETSGYLGLGVTSGIDSRITLATHTTAAGGIRFGPDVTLYRDSNHNLKSDDTLHVEGLIIGASHFTTLATSHGSHDRTITLPDSSGRVALLSNIPTDYVNLDSNQIISGVKTFSDGSLKLFNDTGEGATVLKTATGDGMTASISLPGASGTLIKAQNGGVENYVPRFTATGEYDIDTSGIKIVGEDAEIPGTLKLGKSGSSYKLPDTCGNDDQIMASTGNDGELAWVNPGSLINFIEPKFSLLIDSLMINETAKYPIGYSQGVEIDSVIIVVTSTAGVDQRVGVKFYYGPDMSAAGTTVNTNSNLSAEGYINKAARYGGSTLTNKTVPKGNIIWLKIILDSPKKPRMIHYTIVGHRS